jgi:hypothetical protein
MNTETVHPFERAGLGKAPFRFVGMAQQDRLYGEVILNRAEYQRTGIALTTRAGGTCAYCGTAITNLYNIKSADGRTFHVGCDCVEKTADRALVTAVKAATRKADAVKRALKANAVEAELLAILADPAQRARLEALPHPRGIAGRSLLGWADFMARSAGAAGKARALKACKVMP